MNLLRAALVSTALLTGHAAVGQAYRAHGTEPFWDLTITPSRIVFHRDEERDVAPTPARRPIPGGYRYLTPRFRIDVTREGRCNDGMGEREYSDRVRVYFDSSPETNLDGCGGAVLRPLRLASTGWDIVAIDGARVSGEAYRLDFDEAGRLSGQAGCNRFSGPYRETGNLLRPGPIVATRMACPGMRMTHEAKMLHLLGGPVTLRYPADGNFLVLTGSGVTVRLARQ